MKTLKKRRHRKYTGQRGGGWWILDRIFGKNKEKEPVPGEVDEQEKVEGKVKDDAQEEEEEEERDKQGQGDEQEGGGRRRRYRRRSSRRKRRVSKKY